MGAAKARQLATTARPTAGADLSQQAGTVATVRATPVFNMISPQDLTKAILQCQLCPLHKQGRPVIASGPLSAEVMFIGEAPGYEEVKNGIPFVGQAGRFLNQELLPLAGLERKDIRITNVVLHRPPDNRDPEESEIEACRTWLDMQLEIIDPKVIVLLGRFAMTEVLGIQGLMKDFGGKFIRRDGRIYMISMHPAAALHNPRNREGIMDGFRMLGRVVAALKGEPYYGVEEDGDDDDDDSGW